MLVRQGRSIVLGRRCCLFVRWSAACRSVNRSCFMLWQEVLTVESTITAGHAVKWGLLTACPAVRQGEAVLCCANVPGTCQAVLV